MSEMCEYFFLVGYESRVTAEVKWGLKSEIDAGQIQVHHSSIHLQIITHLPVMDLRTEIFPR